MLTESHELLTLVRAATVSQSVLEVARRMSWTLTVGEVLDELVRLRSAGVPLPSLPLSAPPSSVVTLSPCVDCPDDDTVGVDGNGYVWGAESGGWVHTDPDTNEVVAFLTAEEVAY